MVPVQPATVLLLNLHDCVKKKHNFFVIPVSMWHNSSAQRCARLPVPSGGRGLREANGGLGIPGALAMLAGRGHVMHKHTRPQPHTRDARAAAGRNRPPRTSRKSEPLYRDIFENANDMIATFALDGTI